MLMRTTWRMVVSLMIGSGASKGVMVLEAVAQVAAQCADWAATAQAKVIANSASPAQNPLKAARQPAGAKDKSLFESLHVPP